MTDRSFLSIGDVLALLRDEFPDITISKIRFLESRGLLDPERTPSGYRKFYEADVDRLRWILRQQRENFLPLKVIKGRLEGSPPEDLQSAPRLFDEPDRADLGAPPPAREEEPALVGASVASRKPAGSSASGPSTGSTAAPPPASAPVAAASGGAVMAQRPVVPDEEAPPRTLSLPPGVRPLPSRQHRNGLAAPAPPGTEDRPSAAAGKPAATTEQPVASAASAGSAGSAASAARDPGGAPARQTPPTPEETKSSAVSEASEAARSASRPTQGSSASKPSAPSSTAVAARSGKPGHDAGESVKASAQASNAGSLASGVSMTIDELSDAAGLSIAEIDRLEDFGFVGSKPVAGVRCFDEDALLVARLAAAFSRHGIEPRHLKTFKHAAERQADLLSQLVMPLLRQRNPQARQKAGEMLSEMTDLATSLQSALLRAALKDVTGG